MLDNLNDKQERIVAYEGNLLVTACPGSGKTRVLTHKIAYELQKCTSKNRFVIALTYTNRAAEEIHQRIDSMNIITDQLWCGTIHSFCLEWILRPYGMYSPVLKNGYNILDEYSRSEILDEIKDSMKIRTWEEVVTKQDREGKIINKSSKLETAAYEYHQYLKDNKLIDFDLIIFLSYRLICDYPTIATNLSKMFELICVDEYQDTQDLQYGILGEIMKAGTGRTNILMVGDPDQAIYDGLGGISKNLEQIKEEFGGLEIKQLTLDGCYRSNQRIINYYSNFQTIAIPITSLSKVGKENGTIYYNKTINSANIYEKIAEIIKLNIKNGVPQSEICVVAPRWQLITPCARNLHSMLPGVGFDAPGISPLGRSKENFWYKVSRLMLTEPSPNMYHNRIRWASEIIKDLEKYQHMNEKYNDERKLLKLINSIKPKENDGIAYLKIAFEMFMKSLNIVLADYTNLVQSWDSFFSSVSDRIQRENLNRDICSFKNVFKQKNGIVINTCHGVKGEEFETVIAFGLLQGYIPHWNIIINKPQEKEANSKKLLYVICSRAKSNLYLFSESGRLTQSGSLYKPNEQLDAVEHNYDQDSAELVAIDIDREKYNR